MGFLAAPLRLAGGLRFDKTHGFLQNFQDCGTHRLTFMDGATASTMARPMTAADCKVITSTVHSVLGVCPGGSIAKHTAQVHNQLSSLSAFDFIVDCGNFIFE